MFFILLINITIFISLTNTVRIDGLLCFTVFISILLIASEKPNMASSRCVEQHNSLSSKINFMANCKKNEGAKDSDSENEAEHKCFMMRRYCVKECSENAYTGTCDVKSLFTLNLKVDSQGNFETLDCVCTYNEPKLGCYSTYHFPWKTVTKEFEEKCSVGEGKKVSTKKMKTTTTTTKELSEKSLKLLLLGASEIEYFYPDQTMSTDKYSKPTGLSVLFKKLQFVQAPYIFLLENEIFVVGAATAGDSISAYFDPAKGEVFTVPKSRPIEVRDYAGFAVLNGAPHLCGGYTKTGQTITPSCEQYKDGRWNNISQMNVDRMSFTLTALGKYLYAVGGQTYTLTVQGDSYPALDVVERYDLGSNKWTKMKPMTTERYSHGAAAFNGEVHVCGGFGLSESTVSIELRSCESYNPNTNTWLSTMSLRSPNSNLVVAKNRLFALGSIVEEYKENKWMKVNNTIPETLIRGGFSALALP